MSDFKDSLPNTRTLKEFFIDRNLDSAPRDMLDSVARMIISIENPAETVKIALGYMVDKLGVCRADAGFASPTDIEYTPITEYLNEATCPPSLIGFVMSNQHEVMQRVWGESSPVRYENVPTNPKLEGLRDILLPIQSKSMLMQRLMWNTQPIGISCVDHTRKQHEWSDTEVEFMNHFCNVFFAPLAGISNYWHNPTLHQMFKKPSESELEAVRLAARGLSYKQIASELNKSIRTIDNQLRNARLRLNASNQVDLIHKCAPWLA